MADFAIFSPKLGVSDAMPKMLLKDAFLAPESRNVHEVDGVYKKLRGRLASLLDSDGVQIRPPKYVHAVAAVSVGSKTFSVSGDQTTNVTASIRVNGSTANDGLYTVASSVYSAPNTVITVDEALGDATADGNVFLDTTPVISYYIHPRWNDSADYLLIATAYHILLWNYTDKTLTVKFTCGTPGSVTEWSIDSLTDKVYATNNVDLVQVYDIGTSVGGAFGDLDSGTGLDVASGAMLTACKYLISFEGYLILAYTTEGGAIYPQRCRWSDASDTTEWDEDANNDANHKDMQFSKGRIVGLARHGNQVAVAKTDGIPLGVLVQETTVFSWDEETVRTGVAATGSLVNDRSGRLYYIGDDLLIREIGSDGSLLPLAEGVLRSINKAQVSKIRSIFVIEFNQLYWAIPVDGADDNNMIVAFDIDNRKTYFHSVPVAAFGDYTQQAQYTYDTLPYSTYAEWGAAWLVYDASLNQVGTDLLLVADSDGYTYEMHRSNLDAGAAFEGKMRLATSLSSPPSLNLSKRVADFLEFWFKQANATITVGVLLDGSTILSGIGSLSLTESNQEYTGQKTPSRL